jgi:phage tail sheath protein FI
MDLCENRSDAFYIMDAAGQNDSIALTVSAVSGLDTNYAGVYYPWVKTIDVNTNKLIAVPPSVIMPAVYANNDRLAAEWFAPAGLNRGGLMGAVAVTNRLTHAERDELYEGRVNPIAQFPGQGISAYGQKTLQAKPSALDRINVRRLLLTVRKYIASTSRYLVFEQNTATTRNRFLNIVNPYLESIQQRQGLYAFRVVMDDTNNTPDVIDRNIMKGSIFLQPTKTAEFIQIDFNILPTGASFNA